jgi:uncharacterized protein YndB with AHSA1/START domain
MKALLAGRLAAALLSAAALLAFAMAGSARGEVARKTPQSFHIEHNAQSKAQPAELYRALGEIGRWWSSQHTFSGKAENLSLELGAGGCFCERWAEGSVMHGRVIETSKDRRVRLSAPLGPLLELPVDAILTFAFEPKGGGTAVNFTYKVSGDPSLMLAKLAPPSDKVLGAMLARLIRFAETGKPE